MHLTTNRDADRYASHPYAQPSYQSQVKSKSQQTNCHHKPSHPAPMARESLLKCIAMGSTCA
eukprot:6828991-Prymnesium_polylepis.2